MKERLRIKKKLKLHTLMKIEHQAIVEKHNQEKENQKKCIKE